MWLVFLLKSENNVRKRLRIFKGKPQRRVWSDAPFCFFAFIGNSADINLCFRTESVFLCSIKTKGKWDYNEHVLMFRLYQLLTKTNKGSPELQKTQSVWKESTPSVSSWVLMFQFPVFYQVEKLFKPNHRFHHYLLKWKKFGTNKLSTPPKYVQNG